jgi:hypothetical protein
MASNAPCTGLTPSDRSTAFHTVLAPSDKCAYFTVHRTDSGWQHGYTPLLPTHPAPQGTLRQGPSVADLPGPGVVVRIRDGEANWYLRTVLPAEAGTSTKP